MTLILIIYGLCVKEYVSCGFKLNLLTRWITPTSYNEKAELPVSDDLIPSHFLSPGCIIRWNNTPLPLMLKRLQQKK